jgi:MATE family multidrug resistance protein
MDQTFTIKQKIRQFLYILLPILISQLGLFAMNFFDVIMSGNVSANDLAGVAIGSSLWVPIFTGLGGILMAITPIVAQLIGAKEQRLVSFTVTQAVYASILLSAVVFALGLLFLDPILSLMSLDQDVERIAKYYLIALSTGIVPLFTYIILRGFIDALGYTRITMFITLATLPINIFFNYVLIFGKFGFPALGGVGAGYATAISYWFILIICVWFILKEHRISSFLVFQKLYRVSLSSWKELFLIGIPIGFAIFFEVSIFAAVTLLMSTFNTATIASHQAAINFASFLYMVPMSISMALTILVGFEAGAMRIKDARQYSFIGITAAVALSLFSAAFLLLFRDEIASMYTNDLEVFELTKHFLIYALFFQLSDAVAAPIQGALRGYKDVNVTFMVAFISYWVVGLPLGYILANFTTYGAFGYWIGLIAGLTAGAVGLYARLRVIQSKALTSKQA